MTRGTRQKESVSRALEEPDIAKKTADRSHGGEPSCLDSSGKAVRPFPMIPATKRIKAAERFARPGVCVSRTDRSQFAELATRLRERGRRRDGLHRDAS